MFTPRVAPFKCPWKILFSPFRKCYELIVSDSPSSICQALKMQDFRDFFANSAVFWYIYPQDLRNNNSKHINRTTFWTKSKKSFRCTLLLCPICDQLFADINRIQKWTIFDILMIIIPRLNMINWQMTPLFLCTFWALFVGVFYFYISRALKFSSTEPSLCILFWSVNYTFTI